MPVNISRAIGQFRARPDFNFLADDLQRLQDFVNRQETALASLSKTVASTGSATTASTATPAAPAPAVVAPAIPPTVIIPAKPANAIAIPGLDGIDGEDGLGIPGPPGPAGAAGATGPAGPAGLGLDGLDADEPMMIPGAQGPQGNPGATGPAGPTGLGIDGLDGEDGMGIPGPQGPAGSGGTSALVLLEQHTITTSTASMNFTTSVSATYDTYLVELLYFVPVTNGDSLYMRVSTDGGVTWDSTAGHYNYENWQFQTGFNSIIGSTSDTKIQLSGGVSSTTSNGGICATLKLHDPLNATHFKAVLMLESYRPVSSDGNPYASQGGGSYIQTAAYNAFQFLFSTGNIASGIARCYGIVKS